MIPGDVMKMTLPKTIVNIIKNTAVVISRRPMKIPAVIPAANPIEIKKKMGEMVILTVSESISL